MHFQFPGLLGWAWLVLPIALLFLVRRRPKRVRVSTLAFFKSLAHVYRESPWLRRLKKWLAFAISVATLLLAVGALARLVVAPESGALRSVLVVIDGSASMAATDGNGRSRLDVAKARVRARLAGLQTGIGVLVMRYDRRPEILLPHSYDRREVERIVEGVTLRPIEGDAETALVLAARLARLHAPAAIWHVTDAPTEHALDTRAPDPSDDGAVVADGATEQPVVVPRTPAQHLGLPEEVSLETIDVGLAAPVNVGLTAFQLRPRPLERGRFDAFVRVHASGPKPVEARLEVRLDGRLVSIRDLTVPPDAPERLLVPVEGRKGATLSLEVGTRGDVLDLDDRLAARIPEMRPIRLLWIRESASVDPFTSLALEALGEDGVLEAYMAEPGADREADEKFDVVLYDGYLPEKWPQDVPVLVMKPPRSLGPVRTAPIVGEGLPTSSLRAIDETHPVLYGVANDRVAVTQTGVLEAGGSLTPLWVGDMGPLLVAGEVRGQRIVIMAFAADRSERLGLMASYPLLLGNAIFWLAQDDAEERGGNNLHTGRLVDTEGERLVWMSPEGAEVARSGTRGTVALLDRQGLWRIGDVLGSAALLSKRESRLPPHKTTDAKGGEAIESGFLSGDLRPLLLWLVFALLLLEAWLFHRHAVY